MTALSETLALWKTLSERDAQRKVGPSDLSDSCTYCLARKMLNLDEPDLGPYWLAPRVGTAVHSHHESLVRVDPAHADDLVEQRVTVGEIPGYGVVKGSCDWFRGTDVRDLKTTTKEKLSYIKRALSLPPSQYEVTKVTQARDKMFRYFNQTMLYGLGMENAGRTVETCTIIFICRDGRNDDDMWATDPQDYDRSQAQALLDRASRLWEYLQEGNDLEELLSHPSCYPCSTGRR